MAKERTLVLIVTARGYLQNGLEALMTAIPGVDALDEVSDGATALKVVDERRPHLVLLDTDLPGDEEWRVLRQVKARQPGTQCLVLADNVQQKREAEALGADLVLIKGFPPAKLAETVERLLPQRTIE